MLCKSCYEQDAVGDSTTCATCAVLDAIGEAAVMDRDVVRASRRCLPSRGHRFARRLATGVAVHTAARHGRTVEV